MPGLPDAKYQMPQARKWKMGGAEQEDLVHMCASRNRTVIMEGMGDANEMRK